MPEAVITDALRTPIGRCAGQLAGARAGDIAASPAPPPTGSM